jgi:hypothetical protein
MSNAINYYLNQIASTASESFRTYFDFNSGNNLSILSNKSGDAFLSGVIKPSVGNFWINSGSGYFSGGRYVEITGISNYEIDNKDLTIAIVYENKNAGGATLISTVDTGDFLSYDEFGSPQTSLVYKGFEFGVTSNNRLFFEYYGENGPNIFISDFTLADKNSIYLSITENNMSFGYYDFFQNSLISNNNYVLTDYLFDYSTLFIGYNPKVTGSYNFNKNYTGFIDQFLIFSPSLYTYDLINLNSGIAHLYNSGGLNIETTLITGITGYVSGITGFSTGITGFSLIPTGILTNEWGVEYTGFSGSGISGSIPIFGISGLTGVIFFEQTTGVSGESVTKNSAYINSFGKNYINILSKVDSEDFIDINLNTDIGKNPLNKNINLDYQKYSNNFNLFGDFIENSSPIVYVNGQLQSSGSFVNTGSAYNLSQYIINDYYVDEINSFIFSNLYTENDSVFIDFITGYDTELSIDNFSVPTGVGTVALPWKENTNLYFNGQKLTENLDYIIQPNPPFSFVQKLSGVRAGDNFGFSIATNGDGTVIVVGVRFDDIAGGAVVFTGNSTVGWGQAQKLSGDNINDQYGISVATNSDGTVIVMGGPFSDPDGVSNAGAALVFTGNSTVGWGRIQKLSGDSDQDQFGTSVATNSDGTVIVMGGFGNDGGPTVGSGAALVFTGNSTVGWGQAQKLSGDSAGDQFGRSVATNSDGTVIVMGGIGNDGGPTVGSGAALVFTGNSTVGWGQAQKLSGDSAGDQFGVSVATNSDGTVIVMGGNADDPNGVADAGAALVFTGNSTVGWRQAQKLSGDSALDQFGRSVATNSDGTVIVMGGIGNDGGAVFGSGAALVFTGNPTVGWGQAQKLSGDSADDDFGFSVATNSDGTVIVMGGIGNDGGSTVGSGAAMIFNLQPIIFNQNSYKYTGVSGKLIGINKSTNYSITGTNRNLFASPSTYLYNFSEIYKNGIRQTLNTDYLELGTLDLNTGSGFFDYNPDIIYNNDSLFNL